MLPPHNQMQLSGRAGHDPEHQFLSDGSQLTRLRLYHDATNHEGRRMSTPYTVVAWGPLATVLENTVRKGDNLLVIGTLQLRRRRDDGHVLTHPEIHLTHFYRLWADKPASPDPPGSINEAPTS